MAEKRTITNEALYMELRRHHRRMTALGASVLLGVAWAAFFGKYGGWIGGIGPLVMALELILFTDALQTGRFHRHFSRLLSFAGGEMEDAEPAIADRLGLSEEVSDA